MSSIHAASPAGATSLAGAPTVERPPAPATSPGFNEYALQAIVGLLGGAFSAGMILASQKARMTAAELANIQHGAELVKQEKRLRRQEARMDRLLGKLGAPLPAEEDESSDEG